MSEAAEAADDLDKLAQAADNAGKALEENAKAASLAGAKLDKLKELAIGAFGGEEVVEKYKKGTEALKLFGDKGASAGQRAVAGAVGVKQLGAAAFGAAGAVAGAAQSLIEFIGDVNRATAAVYNHDQRIASLRGSLGAMQQATAGAVDTQVAFNLSLALADRGMEASASTMATLTRATREYASARQVSQEQASAVVQRALDGDAQAATQLGINLSTATNATQRHAQVVSQLEDRFHGVAAGTQTAAEQAQLYERAQERLANKVKSNFRVESLGLLGVAYSALVYLTKEEITATDAQTSSQTRQNAAAEQAVQLAQARNRAEQERATYERRNAAITLGSLNEELQRRGLLEGLTGRVITAEQAYGRARLDLASATQRADENETQFNQRKVELTQRLLDAARRMNAEATRQDGIRRSQAEVGLLAQQIRSHGGIVDARIRSITPAQRMVQLQRELANFTAREKEDVTETLARRTQLMQEYDASIQSAQEAARSARELSDARRTLRELEAEAETLHVKRVSGARVERLGLEALQQRIERQRELNGLTQEAAQDQESWTRLTEQSRASAEKFNETLDEEARLLRERNDTMEQADTERARALFEQANAQRAIADQRKTELEDAQDMERQLRRNFGLVEDLNERSQTATESMAAGAKDAAGGFGELARGIFDATLAAANSGEDVGAAAAKAVDEWATAKAVQWGFQALESLAGAGLAYFIRPDAVPGLLASAATYGGLAAAAGVTAAAIPNAPAASSGAGAGGRDRVASSPRNESASSGKALPAMVFNVSGYTSTESAQEGIVRALQEAQRRGLWQG